MITKQKGCHDIYGNDAKKWQYVNTVIDALMEKYNYKFIRTPIFENSEFGTGIYLDGCSEGDKKYISEISKKVGE